MPKRRLITGPEAAAGATSSSAPQQQQQLHGKAAKRERDILGENVFKGIEKAQDGAHLPQKRFFRQRAHINPLSASSVYQYPIAPERMSWASHYPAGADGRQQHVEVADVGCGFGGLIVGLAPVLPSSLVLGMEIRPKVTEYVRLRLLALRRQQAKAAAAAAAGGSAAAAGGSSTPSDLVPSGYRNASVLKINAMKYLPCFFGRGQLQKLFFCFPDPHFKPANHRRRIVNTDLLAEYAYCLAPGTGRLYTITDVKDLHNWMGAHGDAHPCFVRMSEEELAADPAVAVMREATEEGKKVARQGGDNGKGEKYVACFRRLSDEEAVAREMARVSAASSPASASASASDGFWSEPAVAYEYLPARAQAEYEANWGASKKEKAKEAKGSKPGQGTVQGSQWRAGGSGSAAGASGGAAAGAESGSGAPS